jgi:plasmid maintenance system killer protein
VIASFRDRETEKIWNGDYSRKLPTNIQEAALTKLRILNGLFASRIFWCRPGTDSKRSKATAKGSTAFGSIGNGASVFYGVAAARIKSRL